jgi:tetratricopeptide (TPR) repeat protein
MSDSFRTDRRPAAPAASEGDRDAKVEQLLLAGLDHYFSAQYEQAINIWTRVLFLDRNHARARAYIERARSALAEGQRESEELLQKGIAAFERGETLEARRLIESAIEGGAPRDEALAVLERVNRLEAHAAGGHVIATERPRGQPPAAVAGRRGRRSAAWMIAVAGGVAAAVGAYLVLAGGTDTWRASLRLPAESRSLTLVGPAVDLPLPRRGELALDRARKLAAAGHLADALAALDLVRPTDPQRREVDRLRSEVQQQLLAAAAEGPPAPRGSQAGELPGR